MKRILRGLAIMAGLIGLPLAGQAQVASGVNGPNVTHVVAGGYTLTEQATPYGQPRTWTSASASGTITLTENNRDAWSVYLHDSANLNYQIDIFQKVFKTPAMAAKVTAPTGSGGLGGVRPNFVAVTPATPAQSFPVTEADAVVNGPNATGADVVGGAYRLVSAGQWQDSLGNVYGEAGRDAWSVYLNGPGGRTMIDYFKKVVVHPSNTSVPIGVAYAAATATAPKASGTSPIVAGSAIGAAELKATMQWIAYEMDIENTAICWKHSYGNGVGKAPTDCGAGNMQVGGVCYPNCRAGYSANGTATCTENCPSGYTDTGLLCHYNNPTYVPAITTTQSCTTTPSVCVPIPQVCAPRVCAPSWLGGGCVGGQCTGGGQSCTGGVQVCVPVPHQDGCRSGYTYVAGVCGYTAMPSSGDWTGTPLDPVKHVYTPTPNGVPHCSGSDVKNGLLCFPAPKSNYACPTGNICNETCASGTVDCGPAACAKDSQSCGVSVTNMVIGPLTVVLNIATDGAGGVAILAARDSVKAANEALKTGGDGLGAAGIMQNNIQNAMNAAQNNLAGITSPDIEAQVAGKWGKGSAAYNTIARSWALVDLEILLRQEAIDLANFTESMVDETGVIGTMQAYANPPCEQHTAIP